ncbi:hypothetical protein M501DRAFT_993789 [Patellaria atrata CBS 101060]|uniref:Uncharacterized protein n=1 Tax=Patellaria atrata CBS 101060 TaxID=1346257 RepID=A0A9P4SHF4_9PEZI|nr:hypothetical protein M501DRAFT_993789 [Patellaria atrata CBS 101060]
MNYRKESAFVLQWEWVSNRQSARGECVPNSRLKHSHILKELMSEDYHVFTADTPCQRYSSYGSSVTDFRGTITGICRNSILNLEIVCLEKCALIRNPKPNHDNISLS